MESCHEIYNLRKNTGLMFFCSSTVILRVQLLSSSVVQSGFQLVHTTAFLINELRMSSLQKIRFFFLQDLAWSFIGKTNRPSKFQISLIFSLIKTTDFNGKLNEQHVSLMDVSLGWANTEEPCITTSTAVKKTISLLYLKWQQLCFGFLLTLNRKYCSEVSSSVLNQAILFHRLSACLENLNRSKLSIMCIKGIALSPLMNMDVLMSSSEPSIFMWMSGDERLNVRKS